MAIDRPSCWCPSPWSWAPRPRSHRRSARSVPRAARHRAALPAAARVVVRDARAGAEEAARRAPRRHHASHGGRRAGAVGAARARPARTLVMITALTAAFYVLLPQLADVGDSVDAMAAANWWWLIGARRCRSARTSRPRSRSRAGCRATCPFVPTVGAQLGVVVREPGHPGQRRRDGAQPALPAEGGHRPRPGGDRASDSTSPRVRSSTWCCSSCSSRGRARATRTRSRSRARARILVVIAVVLAVVGLVAATRWGRRILRTHVLQFFRSGRGTSVRRRSPARPRRCWRCSAGRRW